jgi:hypothetical protein
MGQTKCILQLLQKRRFKDEFLRENNSVKAIRYILLSPLGWAIAIVHWIVVAFAILGDVPEDPFFGSGHSSTGLMYILASLNLPATAVLWILFQPLSYLGPNNGTTVIWIFLIIIVVTLQWLSIGAAAQAMYEESRPSTTSPKITPDPHQNT